MQPDIRLRISVMGLFIQSGTVLMIHKMTGPEPGCWDLPGGGLQPGEPMIQALTREIREETGLTEIRVGNLLTIVEGLLLDNEVAYILQGGLVASPLRKVELITASKDLFDFIKNSYSTLNVSQIISDEKTITMVVNGKRISFTLSLQALNSTNVDGIRVKTITV